jgi:hypothetical protein
MAIRNAAKAIILHDGKVLLNKCAAPNSTSLTFQFNEVELI